MMRWVAASAAGILCFGVCACGSELSSAGSEVRIGKGAPEDAKCHELGIVYGSGGGGMYTTREGKLESAQNDLRNKTAELGGNFVIMDISAGDAAGVTLSGRALRCDQGHPQNATRVDAPADREAATIPAAAPQRTEAATERTGASAATQTPEQRIRALDDLHQKGLVTDSEYQARRKEILDSL